MTKVKYSNRLADYELISSQYSGNLTLGWGSTTSALFTDDGSHSEISLTGTGFQYAGNKMTGGHVDKVVFGDEKGHALVTAANADFDAVALLKTIETKGVEAGLVKVFAGKDTFTGSAHGDYMFGYGGADKLIGANGDDALSGGAGNDRLIGGPGSDVFLFSVLGGRDVVVDFDPDGGGKKQDHLNLESGTDYTVRKSGHDTVIDLGHGDTLTLLGVDHTHITKADFDM